METYIGKLDRLRGLALDYIRAVLSARGTNYELIDPNEYEEDLSDEVYKLPRGKYTNMRGYLYEFPIVVIDINDQGELTFKGVDMGDFCRDMDFSENEMEDMMICAIADLVYHLEN